jgi:hypothetical protein
LGSCNPKEYSLKNCPELFSVSRKDVFNVHTIPLGTISGITIGQDDTGEKPADWFLKKVRLLFILSIWLEGHIPIGLI